MEPKHKDDLPIQFSGEQTIPSEDDAPSSGEETLSSEDDALSSEDEDPDLSIPAEVVDETLPATHGDPVPEEGVEETLPPEDDLSLSEDDEPDSAVGPCEEVLTTASDLTLAGESVGARRTNPLVVETAEKEISTAEDWEQQMEAMEEYRNHLLKQRSYLLQRQKQEIATFKKRKAELEKEREETVGLHKLLLNKMESLRVKLQLNNSNAARKSFDAKKQELIAERKALEEQESRLVKELEDSENKTKLLLDKQNEEQQKWTSQQEGLRKEMEQAKKNVEEMEKEAQQVVIAALDAQREEVLGQIDGWLREVEEYLTTLTLDPFEQAEWERQANRVHNDRAQLLKLFQQTRDKLEQGHEVASLPEISAPVLPDSPMVELLMSQMIVPSLDPYYGTEPPASTQSTAGPEPPSLGTAPPHTNPQVAGKLDRLLDKVGARFPHCTQVQLMAILQEIKASRGTMAGMSVDDVIQQVGRKLSAPGARNYLGPRAPTHYPSDSARRPAGGSGSGPRPPQPQSGRRLCLMCQNGVEEGSEYPLSCTHILHKDCISVWLQSSRSNACPFCPPSQ